MVAGHSEGLAWWNFAFLFTITLIPFTSGLLGLYAENPLSVDIFAGNILVGSLASLATARFIKRKGLASAALNQEHARTGRSGPSAWPRSWRCPWRSRDGTRTPPNTCGS